eukprot:10909204-Heterocapsa_arctica.AAC.1
MSMPLACLCVFDVDRTLTGKQHAGSGECPRNQEVPEISDDAYGGGTLHLSAPVSYTHLTLPTNREV